MAPYIFKVKNSSDLSMKISFNKIHKFKIDHVFRKSNTCRTFWIMTYGNAHIFIQNIAKMHRFCRQIFQILFVWISCLTYGDPCIIGSRSRTSFRFLAEVKIGYFWSNLIFIPQEISGERNSKEVVGDLYKTVSYQDGSIGSNPSLNYHQPYQLATCTLLVAYSLLPLPEIHHKNL